MGIDYAQDVALADVGPTGPSDVDLPAPALDRDCAITTYPARLTNDGEIMVVLRAPAGSLL